MGRGAIVVAIVLVAVAGAFGAWRAHWYQTGDFYCLYQGARFIASGQDPYDEAQWRVVVSTPLPSVYGGVDLPPCPGRYGYPLWTAVALLPLGVLPIELAATAWLALSIAAVVIGVALTWRALARTRRYAALFAVAVVTSQPFWIFALAGQISGFLLGLAGATVWALARRRAWGGATLLLIALKPQIVAVAIPAVVLHAAIDRRWRLVAISLATAAAMAALPLVFVPAWPTEWLREVGGRRLRVAGDMPTAWGLANHLFGDMAWGVAIIVAVVAIIALLTRDRLDPVSVFVLSLPLSLLVTPYAWSYDHLVLAVGWGFLFARAATIPQRARATSLLGAALLLACVLPWTLYAVGFVRGEESLTAVVPAFTALAVATAIRLSAPERLAPLG